MRATPKGAPQPRVPSKGVPPISSYIRVSSMGVSLMKVEIFQRV